MVVQTFPIIPSYYLIKVYEVIDLDNDNKTSNKQKKDGEVTTWFMTEEERLAYIEKYPIRPDPKPKVSKFEIDDMDEMDSKKKARKKLRDKLE
jgi:hypothetical protein